MVRAAQGDENCDIWRVPFDKLRRMQHPLILPLTLSAAQSLCRSGLVAAAVHGTVGMRRQGQEERLRLPEATGRRGLQGPAQRLLHVQTLPAQHADTDPGDAGVLKIQHCVQVFYVGKQKRQ